MSRRYDSDEGYRYRQDLPKDDTDRRRDTGRRSREDETRKDRYGDDGSRRTENRDDYYSDGYPEDPDDEERRIRAQRRAQRRARREAQLRRRRRRVTLAAGAGIAMVILAVILMSGADGRSSEDGDAADVASDSVDAEVVSLSTETSSNVVNSGDEAEDTSTGAASAVNEETGTQTGSEDDSEETQQDIAATVYSYYETADTIALEDSLTDISIYDSQRHIASSAETDAVYGDSSDETSSEDTESENGQSATDDDYIDSQYVLVVNADTGEIVAERNAYERIIPASMTKVMTLLVAVEAMEDYEEALSDTFTITQEITDEAYLSGSSFVGYGVGDVATVEDLLYGTILPSGADAAMALAEYTAGTQEAFVGLMNEKAEELGLSDTTHFTNVIGLYDDGENYSTPYDMCVIMNAAIDNEYCRAILSQRTWTTQAIMDNPDGTTISNWFLRRAEDHIDNWELLCGKTGYVNESGNCAVSYMVSSVTGTGYIACTALTYSSWRCIYDHAAIYNYYVE